VRMKRTAAGISDKKSELMVMKRATALD